MNKLLKIRGFVAMPVIIGSAVLAVGILGGLAYEYKNDQSIISIENRNGMSAQISNLFGVDKNNLLAQVSGVATSTTATTTSSSGSSGASGTPIPILTVISPSAGEQLTIGQTYNIRWSDSNSCVGMCVDNTYHLNLLSQDGQQVGFIGSFVGNSTGAGAFSWNVGSLYTNAYRWNAISVDSGSYYIKLTKTEEGGRYITESSPNFSNYSGVGNSFTISPVTIATTTVPVATTTVPVATTTISTSVAQPTTQIQVIQQTTTQIPITTQSSQPVPTVQSQIVQQMATQTPVAPQTQIIQQPTIPSPIASAPASQSTNSDIQNLIAKLMEQIRSLKQQIAAQQGSPSTTSSVAPSTSVSSQTASTETIPASEDTAPAEDNQTELFSYIWNKDLYYGLTNDKDVEALQNVLVMEGCYTGPVTGNFYRLTKAGVICFQKKHNFTNLPGTGYVGSYTRKVLNELYSK